MGGRLWGVDCEGSDLVDLLRAHTAVIAFRAELEGSTSGQ